MRIACPANHVPHERSSFLARYVRYVFQAMVGVDHVDSHLDLKVRSHAWGFHVNVAERNAMAGRIQQHSTWQRSSSSLSIKTASKDQEGWLCNYLGYNFIGPIVSFLILCEFRYFPLTSILHYQSMKKYCRTLFIIVHRNENQKVTTAHIAFTLTNP